MSHSTSWQHVHSWYNSITGVKGHYFHEHVILPRVLSLIKNSNSQSVIDLACGNGILGRSLPNIRYLGIDSAPGLIEHAKKNDAKKHHWYMTGDMTRTLTETFITNSLPDWNAPLLFDAATCILALQNIQDGSRVIENISHFVKEQGLFILVLNHPSFRIPRQSGWGIDEKNKLQYRKIMKYMSPLEIPITMNPGQKTASHITWSYHYPLSTYTQWLKQSGFVISDMEEWTSDKESVGKAAKMENTARNEIPLFLCIVAKKV